MHSTLSGLETISLAFKLISNLFSVWQLNALEITTTAHVLIVLGITLNCIYTEWCPGHKLHSHFHCRVLDMTLNCIHIFIVTGSFLYWCVMRPASRRFFIHSCIYLRILIISYLATFLGTNSLSVLMCRKAVTNTVKQSINQLVGRTIQRVRMQLS